MDTQDLEATAVVPLCSFAIESPDNRSSRWNQLAQLGAHLEHLGLIQRHLPDIADRPVLSFSTISIADAHRSSPGLGLCRSHRLPELQEHHPALTSL